MYEHDPRHFDVLVEDLGLEQGDSVKYGVTEEEPELLDQVQHSRYRSQVAGCSFFSPDRADMTLSAKLKRLVRCLKRETNGRTQTVMEEWPKK